MTSRTPALAAGGLIAAGIALLISLAGCALTPPKPPECEGPWVPVNTHAVMPQTQVPASSAVPQGPKPAVNP